jgi:hypothetical protein
LVIQLCVFITAMKIPRHRKSNKKKNYGSSSIPRELANNKWWQLVYKVSEKEAQTIYYLL